MSSTVVLASDDPGTWSSEGETLLIISLIKFIVPSPSPRWRVKKSYYSSVKFSSHLLKRCCSGLGKEKIFEGCCSRSSRKPARNGTFKGQFVVAVKAACKGHGMSIFGLILILKCFKPKLAKLFIEYNNVLCCWKSKIHLKKRKIKLVMKIEYFYLFQCSFS